ncbi:MULTISPECIES: class I adenylate-forming enzyme family protein [unclassified Rhodococcus (in: high G+C Gram-positive bacteria)]|uniref:class I adenylate-forming enzyme family protein n=1 Tax=unclassified Rhodococcus (in: high G+C Gram-positive bacteria) TaxID=192944 RepID=UPI00163B32FC|nr:MULTISPECIES: AMP-binding protein [unclassified Rhodococcus (in: high G+C Gram-positive bacteria)]MBC2644231.1 AMP-binding protein [Rhodococcus sp. 3A]MBC2891030.1 AMP-binding protein [Rhodococcus sp. 4CII]
MNFASLPDLRAESDPHGPAISDASQSLTNAQLLTRVRAAAHHLRGLGIGPGDVVALRLTNRAEFVVLLFATWRLGATITPVNPALTDAEVARQLGDAGARLLVTEADATPITGLATLAVGTLPDGPVESEPAPTTDPSALALLIYTSGTTGVPKGVMLDHANIDAMAEMGVHALGVGPADRCLLILPLFHVNGIVVSVLTPLLAGASVVIAGRFDPRTFFHLVETERPTYFSAVPTIYNILAALPGDVRPDTSSLRFGVCGAAPAPPELLTRFEARYGFPLVEGYGLSEGTCATTLNPVTGPRRPGTVGIAFPGQEIRIVDENGDEMDAGVDGEVVVRGPNIMRGYLGRPDETARTVVDGWLHTGDVGHLDADGYLTLVGRSKDLIIRGGENIYPKEIEDVLAGDPDVLEAAVIGVPDDKWGEVVIAYVQPRPGRAVDPTALTARCAHHLSHYKRPTSIVVVDAIAKNAVGKIDKTTLRATHVADQAVP